MAKVNIKSEKATFLGGNSYEIMLIDLHIDPTKDGKQGLRNSTSSYQYSDTIRSLILFLYSNSIVYHNNNLEAYHSIVVFMGRQLPYVFVNQLYNG